MPLLIPIFYLNSFEVILSLNAISRFYSRSPLDSKINNENEWIGMKELTEIYSFYAYVFKALT